MDRKLGVHLASPARGRVSFLLELYVKLFDSHRFINNLRPVASYPRSLNNMFTSAGLLYIHSGSKAVSVLGWNPPFRAYTTAIWCFFTSNVFLVVVPWIPPAPGYQVYERLPYYVSELRGSRSRDRVPRVLTADHQPHIVTLRRGIGDCVYGCRVLVCKSGLSAPQRGIQT